MEKKKIKISKTSLNGKVKVSGAKNSALRLLAALNPSIEEVKTLRKLLLRWQ